jgi:UDP-glucose 4-epimerase
MQKNYAITGGAGFIGSHFVDNLLQQGHRVTVVDNFCSGSLDHVAQHVSNPQFSVIEGNIENTQLLCDAFLGINTVIHLASNPDIARAASEPRIDFTQGTVLTESVAEAARIAEVRTILYASGSGVYGDAGSAILTEDSPLNPISTYGASKLAGESLLSAYSYMFGIRTRSFRFANVVGARQTHGVGFDFVRRLKKDSSELLVLGNGKQSKSYISVSDVVRAVLLAEEVGEPLNDVFNISTDDFMTVNEIAEEAIRVLGLTLPNVKIRYTGGDRGWKADVPVVRIDSQKIKNLGWRPNLSSKEAIKASLLAMAF